MDLILILSATRFSKIGAGPIHFYPLCSSCFYRSASRERGDSFLWALNLTTESYNPTVLDIAFLICWPLNDFIFIDQS